MEGTAEPGAFITLLDGGIFTVTLENPTGADGRWAGEYLLHGGVNRIVAVAHDTTGIPSPPSNYVRVTHFVHPPLYGIGTDPATVAAGDTTRLWAHVRGHWPMEGAATTAAWAFPPVGEPLSLTHRTAISAGQLWLWDNPWAVPAGLPSQDAVVYLEAVDGDNLTGWGEVGLAIRNAPPAPQITGPAETYLTDARFSVWGIVRSAEALTVSVREGADERGRARSVGWDPTVGVNWQAVVTLSGEGAHTLWAQASSDFGLVSAPGPARTFILDLHPPTVTLGALPPYTNALDLNLRWAGDDGAGSGIVGYGVEHRYGGGEWGEWASGGAEYTAALYPLHQEGVYGLRVRAVDRVGRVGYSAAQSVVADRTPPTLTLALTENSPYAHVAGQTAYYGVGSGGFTVTATLADGTAGLAEVVFPDATTSGAAYGLNGAASAAVSHAYTFTAASTFSGAVPVTVTDRATNVTVRRFTVERDATAPQVWLDAPTRVYTAPFTVTWGASDAQAGVAWYDLDVSVDGGSWQRVLTQTTATAHTIGQSANYFFFRLTATDHVSNSAVVTAVAFVPAVTKYYHHGGARVAMRAGGVVYYLHADHLGSTSLTTDAGGNRIAEMRYLPYGGTRYEWGHIPTDRRYTGQRWEPSLGLYDYRARYYHPGVGRFISADTIVPEPGNPQDLNRYAYVRNNPLKYTDPSGHILGLGDGGRRKREPPPPLSRERGGRRQEPPPPLPREPGRSVPDSWKQVEKILGIAATCDIVAAAASINGLILEGAGFIAGVIGEPSPGGGEAVSFGSAVLAYYTVINPIENRISSWGAMFAAAGDYFGGRTYFDRKNSELVIGQDTIVSYGVLALGNQGILSLEGVGDTLVNAGLVAYDMGRLGERIPTVAENRVGFSVDRGGFYVDLVVYGALAERWGRKPGDRYQLILNLSAEQGWVP